MGRDQIVPEAFDSNPDHFEPPALDPDLNPTINPTLNPHYGSSYGKPHPDKALNSQFLRLLSSNLSGPFSDRDKHLLEVAKDQGLIAQQFLNLPSGNTCPICKRSFKSQIASKSHYFRAHGSPKADISAPFRYQLTPKGQLFLSKGSDSPPAPSSCMQ